jgi:sporulation protein YqfC
MKIIDKLTDYIYDKEVSIHIYHNSLNVINYKEISNFSNSKVTITYKDGTITVSGKSLVVSKLLGNEILISGEIKQIELG